MRKMLSVLNAGFYLFIIGTVDASSEAINATMREEFNNHGCCLDQR